MTREAYRAGWFWPFAFAPGKLKALLPTGQTGLWVVSVPRELDGPELGWIRTMGQKVTRHQLDADVIYVVSNPREVV